MAEPGAEARWPPAGVPTALGVPLEPEVRGSCCWVGWDQRAVAFVRCRLPLGEVEAERLPVARQGSPRRPAGPAPGAGVPARPVSPEGRRG